MVNSTISYKLYGIPYLGFMAIELLMEEAGIKYDIIFSTLEERGSVEFKKISPRGLVPVLITPSGQSIFEGPAIINFLLETHQTNLIAPISNPDRATCFQWLSFLSTALGNANNRFFFLIDTALQKLISKKKLNWIGRLVTISWKNTLTVFYQEKLVG